VASDLTVVEQFYADADSNLYSVLRKDEGRMMKGGIHSSFVEH